MTPVLPKEIRLTAHRLCLIGSMLILILVTSCTKSSTGDLADLLKTVPSDATTVMTVNVHTVLEKSGCKVDESGKVTLSPALDNLIKTLGSPVLKENIRAVIAGDAGVAPTFAVAFTEGDDSFLTFVLDDPDKFISFAESVTGEKAVATGEIQVCGYMARLANQGWMRIGNTALMDAGHIARYSDLTESQSFCSLDIADKFLKSEKEFLAWANIDALVSLRGGSFTDRTVARMAISTIFDDAAIMMTEGKLSKERFSMESRILTSKGEDARCNFSTSKIDVKTLEGFGGAADMVLAGNISRQLSRQLRDIMASQFGGVGEVYAPLLSPLDGTFVAALSRTEGKSSLRMLVTTDGKSPVSDLMKYLNDSFGTVKRDGKLLKVDNGASSGDIALDKDSGRLSGAWLGMMADRDMLISLTADPTYAAGVAMVVLKVTPDNGGLKITLDIDTENEGDALASVLRLMAR